MSRSHLSVSLAAALAVLALLSGACRDSSPGAVSLRAYKENVPKFQALLPQWSRWVGEADEKGFQDGAVGPVKGKVVFVGREYTPLLVEMKKRVDPVTLHFKNDSSDLHQAGLIAGAPEEVGTVVFIHTLLDQSKQYEGLASYSTHKFHVFLVDAATGKVVGRREIRRPEKFDPPATVKGSGPSLYPYEQLDQFVASLSPGKP